MITGSSPARALRNKNPGNIRIGDPWQGLNSVQNDPDFCMFESPRWGFRAMAITLVSYQDRYNLRTVRQIIGRWAPPIENQTEAYISHVCRETGFEASQRLDMHSYADNAAMSKAIAIHEGGSWLFDDRELEAGLRSAGIEPPQQSFITDRGVPPKLISGGTLVTSGAMDQLGDMRDQLGPYAYTFKWGAALMFALTLAIIGYQLYKHADWKRVGLR